MPFRSLADPVDVARAHAAFDRAWSEFKAGNHVLLGSEENERQRLALIVAGYVHVAEDEDDLVRRALRQFRGAEAASSRG